MAHALVVSTSFDNTARITIHRVIRIYTYTYMIEYYSDSHLGRNHTVILYSGPQPLRAVDIR